MKTNTNGNFGGYNAHQRGLIRIEHFVHRKSIEELAQQLDLTITTLCAILRERHNSSEVKS